MPVAGTAKVSCQMPTAPGCLRATALNRFHAGRWAWSAELA